MCGGSSSSAKAAKAKRNTHLRHAGGRRSTFTPVYNVQQEHPGLTHTSHIPLPAHTQRAGMHGHVSLPLFFFFLWMDCCHLLISKMNKVQPSCRVPPSTSTMMITISHKSHTELRTSGVNSVGNTLHVHSSHFFVYFLFLFFVCCRNSLSTL